MHKINNSDIFCGTAIFQQLLSGKFANWDHIGILHIPFCKSKDKMTYVILCMESCK